MALMSDFGILRLFHDEEKAGVYSKVIKAAYEKGAEVVPVGGQAAEKLAFGKTTQGIFAEVVMKKYGISEAGGALIVALEDLADPGNMGTIIRTADAVGVRALIISGGCVDIYNDKVIRASMGSLFNVKTIICEDFIKCLSELGAKSYNLACGHLAGEDFFSREKHGKNVLVIGSEARGVSEEAAAICRSLWKLPMQGGAESLNAAVAAGIMMYDIMRAGG